MNNSKRPINSKVAEIYSNQQGNKSETATALNVTRQTLHNWIKDDSKLADLLDDVDEANVDFTESQKRKLIKGFTVKEEKALWNPTSKKWDVVTVKKYYPPNPIVVIFDLKTKGKKRGYIERTEFAVPEDVKPFTGIAMLDPRKKSGNGKGIEEDIHS